MPKKKSASSMLSTVAFSATQVLAAINNSGINFNQIRFANGAALGHLPLSGSVTIAAGNQKRVQSMYDLGALIRSIALSLTDNKLNTKSWNFVLDFYSTLSFAIQPWLVAMENGESVTATDANTGSMETPLDTALGAGAQDRVYGPIKTSVMTYSNGTPYYRTRVTVMCNDLIKRYVADLAQKELNESTPAYLELFLGVTASGAATTAVNYSGGMVYTYSFEERRITVL